MNASARCECSGLKRDVGAWAHGRMGAWAYRHMGTYGISYLVAYYRGAP